MVPSSSAVATWELVLRLRVRREELGIPAKDIPGALGFTRNYWSAVENERRILSAEKLATLLDLLEFEPDERRELIALREVAKQRGWWTAYSGMFGDELSRYFGLEHGAQSLRTYEGSLVPGLLQTEEYARAIMTADIAVRDIEVDRRLEVRLRRQERLLGDDPLRYTAIISESALAQQIGGRLVQRRQLDHLATMIEELPDTLRVLVVPFTATDCGLFGASTLCLLDFESPRLPTLVWQETVTKRGFVDDSDKERDISLTYTHALRRSTLDVSESLSLIRKHAKE